MKKIFTIFISLFILIFTISTNIIPAFADAAVDYGNNSFSRIRQATLADEVNFGQEDISADAFWDQGPDKKNEYTRLVKSTIGISDEPMFKVRRTTAQQTASNAEIRVATLYTQRKTSINAEALMYYMEIPDDIINPTVQFSWNMYSPNSIEQKSGHIYQGTCYYLLRGTTSWVQTQIKDLWFNLPTGFQGYIMFETKDLDAGYADDWQLETTHIYIPNLMDQAIVIAAPFIVEDLGILNHAAYINAETKAVRDIFTGKELSKEEAVIPMKTGDILYEIPKSTAKLGVSAPDQSYLPEKLDITWNAFNGASKYSVRLFKMTNTESGKVFIYEKEQVTDQLKVTFEDLQANNRYYVIVYVLDSNGDEIAVSENLNIFAVKGVNFNNTDTPNEPDKENGLDTTVIIIIAVSVAAVIAVVIVVVVLLNKKKKA